MPPTIPPLTGAVFAAAVLLVATGSLKLLRPDPTAAALVQAGIVRGARVLARGIGVAELAIAVAVLGTGGFIPVVSLAAAYAGFTGFVLLALRRPDRIRTCGCAGDAPPTSAHAVVTVGFTGAALAAAVSGIPSVPDALAVGADGAVLLGYAGVVAMLAWAVLTVLPLALRPPAGADPRKER